MVNDCKLEPKENPGSAEGIEDELNAGKLELNKGKPIELDKGERDKGPNSDKLELGKIEGKEEEYSKGNELEAKGTPLLINGNNEGVTLKEAKGNKEISNRYRGRSNEGPLLLNPLDDKEKGAEDRLKGTSTEDCKDDPKAGPDSKGNNVVNDCKLDPKENPGSAEGIEDELNAGKLELNKGKPIELDKGERDKGPNSDKLELGKIEGKEEEYSKGNELEAKGTPLLINGNSEGVTLKEAKGNNELVNR